jgi:DNA-binding beta-propeller fold protein YncE
MRREFLRSEAESNGLQFTQSRGLGLRTPGRIAASLFLGISWAAVAVQAFAADGVLVLIGSVDGRQGEPSAEKVNEPFAIDFDAWGVLYGVEFTRGNRVFRSTQPIAKWKGESELPVDFMAGGFRVTRGGQPDPLDLDANAPVRFHGMHDLAVSPDGRIFLADTFHHCLRAISARQCHVSVIAGNGTAGFSGDGGPAAEAVFNEPYCGSLSPDGTKLLVADIRNHRLRVIDLTTQTVSTIAGNGERGTPIDGAVATESPLAGPRAACMADDGTVYLVLREGNALVAIRDGRLQTVVNAAGSRGYSGDGGPGRDAQLSGPKYVCMDRSGGVLIVDTENHCVRRYDPGTEQIDLVAGVPPKAGAAVGEGWRQTELRRPHGARIAPDGRLVIADSDNDRVLIGPYGGE